MIRKIRIITVFLLIFCIGGCNQNNTQNVGDIYTDISGESIESGESVAASIAPDDLMHNNNSSGSIKNNSKNNTNSETKSKISSSKVDKYYSSIKNNKVYGSGSKTVEHTDSGYANTSSKTENNLKLSNIFVKGKNISSFKTVGICLINNAKGIALNWGGASVEFDILCKGELILTFSPQTEGDSVWLKIAVDNISNNEQYEINKTTEIIVANNLNYGVHRVKIIRQTDAEAPPIIFKEIKVYGELINQAPSNKDIYIEAVGDSSLLGQGVLLPDSFFVQGFSKETAKLLKHRDATKTYPFLAAEKIDADCYLIAKDGMGFAATSKIITQEINNVAVKVCDSARLLPTVYPHVSAYSNELYSQERLPDILVLDIGLTDIQSALLQKVLYKGKVGITSSVARTIAIEFLSDIKEQNPKLKIIWCYGLLGNYSAHRKYIQGITQALGGEQNGFYTLELPSSTRSGYPSYAEHNIASDLLLQKIKAIV